MLFRSGLIRPSKKKSPDKIDGVSAMLTALDRATAPREEPAWAGVVT